MEFCPLSRGIMLHNPYPPHYKGAFAFSILLYPHLHRLALRLAFPIGEDTGLPRFAWIPFNGLGLASPPVVLHLR